VTETVLSQGTHQVLTAITFVKLSMSRLPYFFIPSLYYCILMGKIFYLLLLCLFHTNNTDKTKLPCLVRVGGVNWIGDKTAVFSSPWYIWDWTVANWKLGRDETKLNSHRISRQEKNVLSPFTFSSHNQQFCLVCDSAVWNRR